MLITEINRFQHNNQEQAQEIGKYVTTMTIVLLL